MNRMCAASESSSPRMLCFMVQAGISAIGMVWSMRGADTQCTVERREKAKGKRKFF